MPLRSTWTSPRSLLCSCTASLGHSDLPRTEQLTTSSRKPSTSLGDPWPAPTILPKITQLDDCGDYESELAVVIGKPAKNVSEADALDYVLGYTAANDVSSRTAQFAQSQWNYSKGFDGACPLGMVALGAKSELTGSEILTFTQVRHSFPQN